MSLWQYTDIQCKYYFCFFSFQSKKNVFPFFSLLFYQFQYSIRTINLRLCIFNMARIQTHYRPCQWEHDQEKLKTTVLSYYCWCVNFFSVLIHLLNIFPLTNWNGFKWWWWRQCGFISIHLFWCNRLYHTKQYLITSEGYSVVWSKRK